MIQNIIEFIQPILEFVLVLASLIIIHELGHFLACLALEVLVVMLSFRRTNLFGFVMVGAYFLMLLPWRKRLIYSTLGALILIPSVFMVSAYRAQETFGTRQLSVMEIISPDVKKDPDYRGLVSGSDLRESLLLDALAVGYEVAGRTPVLLVNEPIFVANGMHSDVRYNDLYPRWAYDQYRGLLAEQAQKNSINFLDMWNTIPPEFFTDTPLHLSADGERLFAEQLNPKLLPLVCP